MTTTIDALAILQIEECPTCFVTYAVSKEMLRRRREEGGHWYCPNGHTVIYTKSELAKVREALEIAQRAAIDARVAADIAEREAANARKAQRAEVTRRQNIEKRVRAGVCTKCHRHFPNVQAHYETKHPGEEPPHDN